MFRNGKLSPKLYDFEKIAKTLGISVKELKENFEEIEETTRHLKRIGKYPKQWSMPPPGMIPEFSMMYPATIKPMYESENDFEILDKRVCIIKNMVPKTVHIPSSFIIQNSGWIEDGVKILACCMVHIDLPVDTVKKKTPKTIKRCQSEEEAKIYCDMNNYTIISEKDFFKMFKESAYMGDYGR